MKKFLLTALQFLCAGVATAKLDLQLHECTVNAVAISEAQITLTVSGSCEFMMAKDNEGNGSVGESVLNHAALVIRRAATSPNDWKSLSDKIAALKSKKIWMDCTSTTIIVEGGQVNYASCLEATFGEDK